MGTAVKSPSGFEPKKYPKYPDSNKQDTQYHIYQLTPESSFNTQRNCQYALGKYISLNMSITNAISLMKQMFRIPSGLNDTDNFIHK